MFNIGKDGKLLRNKQENNAQQTAEQNTQQEQPQQQQPQQSEQPQQQDPGYVLELLTTAGPIQFPVDKSNIEDVHNDVHSQVMTRDILHIGGRYIRRQHLVSWGILEMNDSHGR